jgi:hypothetical protein
VAEELEGGLWLPIGEIARIKRRSKQAISKRVAVLAADGKLTTRKGEGGTKLVNLAAYNLAIGETGDPAKELALETAADADAPATSDTAAPAQPGYRDAQTRKTQFEADLRELELRQKLGELVPLADVKEADEQIAAIIVRVLERKLTRVDELAAAVGQNGAQGCRAKLKEIIREERLAIADALRAAKAAEAPDAQSPDVPAGP